MTINEKLNEFKNKQQNRLKLLSVYNATNMANNVYDKHNIGQEVLNHDILDEFQQLFSYELTEDSMNKTKIQAMIDFLEIQIQKINIDRNEYTQISVLLEGVEVAYKTSLEKAIEIQNNDDLDWLEEKWKKYYHRTRKCMERLIYFI